MLIDWFTLGAQLVNFLILAALLERFVYRRILRTIDEREQAISARLDEAESTKEEAARQAELLRKEHNDWNGERQHRLARATEDVRARRGVLLQEARVEVDALRGQWHDALERDKESFLARLRIQAGRHAYALARRALADLADRELEGHILRVFIARLRQADPSVREGLATSAQTPAGKIVIRSAFALSASERKLISQTVREALSADADIRFVTSPELICGIELATTNHKLGWSLQSYLADLEELSLEALDANAVAGNARGETGDTGRKHA